MSQPTVTAPRRDPSKKPKPGPNSAAASDEPCSPGGISGNPSSVSCHPLTGMSPQQTPCCSLSSSSQDAETSESSHAGGNPCVTLQEGRESPIQGLEGAGRPQHGSADVASSLSPIPLGHSELMLSALPPDLQVFACAPAALDLPPACPDRQPCQWRPAEDDRRTDALGHGCKEDATCNRLHEQLQRQQNACAPGSSEAGSRARDAQAGTEHHRRGEIHDHSLEHEEHQEQHANAANSRQQSSGQLPRDPSEQSSRLAGTKAMTRLPSTAGMGHQRQQQQRSANGPFDSFSMSSGRQRDTVTVADVADTASKALTLRPRRRPPTSNAAKSASSKQT